MVLRLFLHLHLFLKNGMKMKMEKKTRRSGRGNAVWQYSHIHNFLMSDITTTIDSHHRNGKPRVASLRIGAALAAVALAPGARTTTSRGKGTTRTFPSVVIDAGPRGTPPRPPS